MSTSFPACQPTPHTLPFSRISYTISQSYIHLYIPYIFLVLSRHFDRISMPENYTCVVCRCGASEPAGSYFCHFLTSNVFFRHPPFHLIKTSTPYPHIVIITVQLREINSPSLLLQCKGAIRNLCQMHKTNLSASCADSSPVAYKLPYIGIHNSGHHIAIAHAAIRGYL